MEVRPHPPAGAAVDTMKQRPDPNQYDPRERRRGVVVTAAIVGAMAVLVYVATLMGWIAR